MTKVGKEVLSCVICETSLKPWVILWYFELKGSVHQNVLTRSRLAGCMGGSGAKIRCGSQSSPQIHVPICLAPGLRWLSVILVKHKDMHHTTITWNIKAIKTNHWQCTKGPFPHLTFSSWDFVMHRKFKTFNKKKKLSLVLNYKWILFCRKRSEKDFVCLSVESPVSQWLSLVCHILTSLYLSPPGGVDTHHVPDIWEQPIPPSFPWVFHPSFPDALEATSLMGTAYLYPVPYQIVDTKRYPRNENIFLLLTLTLAYMDRHLYPRWDKQLLCSVCVGGCECLWVSASADRCIK